MGANLRRSPFYTRILKSQTFYQYTKRKSPFIASQETGIFKKNRKILVPLETPKMEMNFRKSGRYLLNFTNFVVVFFICKPKQNGCSFISPSLTIVHFSFFYRTGSPDPDLTSPQDTGCTRTKTLTVNSCLSVSVTDKYCPHLGCSRRKCSVQQESSRNPKSVPLDWRTVFVGKN